LFEERSNASRLRATRGTRYRSFCAKVARLSSAHARTNFCGCSRSRRRISTARFRSLGVHERSGSVRTIWSRISHLSLSRGRPLDERACAFGFRDRSAIAAGEKRSKRPLVPGA
jgi:hypothetical protein